MKIVNAKDKNVKDIADYELVVVGSGMAMENWVGQADFVKKFQKDLENKRVALFISSLKPIEEESEKNWCGR